MINDNIGQQQCSKCLEIKELNKFYFRDKKKNIRRTICKSCTKIQRMRPENKDNRKKQAAESYLLHKEKRLAKNKQYREDNKEILSDKHRAYYENNKVGFKAYQNENKDKLRIAKNKRKKERRQEDLGYRLSENMSVEIRTVLKINGATKNGRSSLKVLGYSREDLKIHIESQFEYWMNWDNQGKYDINTWNDNDITTWKWQIDHIKPHSEFHYKTMDCQEFRDCWTLSNLRPLSAKQNILDGTSRIRHKKIQEIQGIPIIIITDKVSEESI